MAKILVIDDDDFVRRILTGFLTRENHEIFEATNGDEGIEVAKDNPPDIVITDMLMPGKEGIETILELQMMCPGVKIIAISGGGNSKNMTFLQMAEKLGAHKTLEKPFKAEVVSAAINELLG